ncbi:hypothetical protein chiPu_0020950 [Chiloscyllium punctatum]|uniref:Uncharacterized protein n=1 Tax=Chiloscyllium punctatum TaxID=137246 RepID=A0A401RLP7_CHIPU|nr:hypothetical protein [Chiloscyllium punctatum]
MLTLQGWYLIGTQERVHLFTLTLTLGIHAEFGIGRVDFKNVADPFHLLVFPGSLPDWKTACKNLRLNLHFCQETVIH